MTKLRANAAVIPCSRDINRFFTAIPQFRTLCGNIANAPPRRTRMPVLIALGLRSSCAGGAHTRVLRWRRLSRYQKKALARGELAPGAHSAA